jgi:GNAT superfamily N-acetyltransferase
MTKDAAPPHASQCPVQITAVSPACSKEVVRFALDARALMFGERVADGEMPEDLRDFAATYLDGPGCFLTARDTAGRLVGCIAYRAYDHRFAQLDYRGQQVAEVVRLFVLPEWRRTGMAGALYAALREQAVQEGIEVLYLHTHPFLPGAQRFWEQQGFRLLCQDADPLWQTLHMDCRVGAI